MVRIILPFDSKKKEYILYLYKNRNDFHKMNNRDINNLIKLINNGKINNEDYPDFKKNKKKSSKKLKGFCFSFNDNCFSLL